MILGARGRTDIEAKGASIALHQMDTCRLWRQIRQPRAELNSAKVTVVKHEDQIAVMQDTHNTLYPPQGDQHLVSIWSRS